MAGPATSGLRTAFVTVLRAACVALSVSLLLAVSAKASPPLQWSAPTLVDNVAPFGYALELQGLSCPSVSLCVAVGREDVLTSTKPSTGGPWIATRVTAHYLQAVSCPSPSLCVAVDHSGNVVASAEPSGGAHTWSSSPLQPSPGELTDVTCPSTRLCVATGYPLSFVSTEPVGGASTWVPLPAPPGVAGSRIACPSASTCVALNSEGQGFQLLLDSAGHGSWTRQWGLGSSVVRDVSCPSLRLCVAVDDAGEVGILNTPGDPASSWTTVRIDSAPLRGVSCASESLCVAVDSLGDLTTSTNPRAGASAWSSPVNVDPNAGSTGPDGSPLIAPGILQPVSWLPQPIACVAATLCLSLDRYGHALYSTDPAGGASTWHMELAASGRDGFVQLACPSPSLCAAIDDAARVVTSTRPGEPHAPWHVTTIPGLQNAYEWGIACTRKPLCVAFDRSYTASHEQPEQLVASVHPDGGTAAWRSLFPGYPLVALPAERLRSCPWKTLCFSWRNIDGQPTALIITERRRRAKRSRYAYLPLFGGTSCPSAHFCAWVGPGGERARGIGRPPGPTGALYTSRHPLRRGRWRATRIGPHALRGVSCASQRLCVAFDDAGDVLSSTRPLHARAAWKLVHLAGGASLAELHCPSTSLCSGRDDVGDVVVSTTPTGGAQGWTTMALAPQGAITALGCPSPAVCVAGDLDGDELIGTRLQH